MHPRRVQPTLEVVVTEASIDSAERYQRYGIPELGFRNYWYPAMTARSLGKKPKAVRLLGENIVVFRDGAGVYALQDRCPHRGAKLSPGRCEFPGSGSISCPYHGWTFDGRSGKLVAALMEGPDAAVVNKVGVKSYPVAVRAGLIFIFVGDMEAPPVEDDLPPFMADPAKFFSLSVGVEYANNWRSVVDNFPYDHHAQYVHRNSPELIFMPQLPFAQRITFEDLDGNNGLSFHALGGINKANFPGLGVFPRREFWRFLKPTGRANVGGWDQSKAFRLYGIKSQLELRLPSNVTVGRKSGEYSLVQWAVPVDEHRTILFNINCFRRNGALGELWNRLHYYSWRRWVHDWLFSGQDKTVIEASPPGPERLSRTDAGLVAWRRYAGENARRPPTKLAGLRDAS